MTDLFDEVEKIKLKIIELENNQIDISETDTRQGLINPLFKKLNWDFTDFISVRSEYSHPDFKDPVDYAFFSSKNKDKPILILEAKKLGSNLNDKKTVQQLSKYLFEFGVQWGVLTDGNKYVMYNSRGGNTYEDQKFISIEIKNVDTEDGLPMAELCEHLTGLLSKSCLENEEIQNKYESHMKNNKITEAFESLLSKPFDTLAKSIQKEFKEENVGLPQGYKISKHDIENYLNNIADEEGRINLEQTSISDHVDAVDEAVANSQLCEDKDKDKDKDMSRESNSTKRIKIMDLLKSNLLCEGDNLKINIKGEIFWARVTGNGHLDVDGKEFTNPSRAASDLASKSKNGWYHWHFKNTDGSWERIMTLRDKYEKICHEEKIVQFVKANKSA